MQMYKNSLVLRVCMTEKPFIHKKAFANVKSSFIYHEDLAKVLFKIINKKGIINVGGKTQTIYNFARRHNPGVKKLYLKNKSIIKFPRNPSINVKKFKKLINF